MATPHEEQLRNRIIRRMLAQAYPWKKARIGQIRALDEGAVFLMTKDTDNSYTGILVSPDFAYEVCESGTLAVSTLKAECAAHSAIPIDPLAGYLYPWTEVRIRHEWLRECLADLGCAAVSYVQEEKTKGREKSSRPSNLVVASLQKKLLVKWLRSSGNLGIMEA